MAENTLQVLVGEKEELYTIVVSPEEQNQILGGSKLVIKDSFNLGYVPEHLHREKFYSIADSGPIKNAQNS